MKQNQPRAISLPVIESTQKFLNHVLAHLSTHNCTITGRIRMELADQYNRPYDIFYAAERCGYIQKVGIHKNKRDPNNKWKVCVTKFEPIHARNVLNNHYDHHNGQVKMRKLKASNPEISKAAEIITTEKPKYNTRKDNVRKPIVPDEKINLSPETSVRNSNRSQSYKPKKAFVLFWGLLKINW